MLAGVRCSGRRLALLGDMLELGPDEGPRAHADALEACEKLGLDCATAGPQFQAAAAALPKSRRPVLAAANAAELAAEVGGLVSEGDVVLVKGSRGSRMELVAEALMRPGDGRD